MTFTGSATERYSVTVSGDPVTIIAGTLTIDKAVGRRSTAAFYVKSNTATHFQQYQQMAIYDVTDALVFSGYITNPQEGKPGFQPSLVTQITCCDQHFLADKRIIAAAYQNQTPAQIVQDIVTNYLASEGVTIGAIYDPNPALFASLTTLCNTTTIVTQSSMAIPNAVFGYCTVAAALDALVTSASDSGVPYYWQIDQNKKLWFVPYTYLVNSTVVDGTQIDQVYTPPTVTRANPTYRNTQYIIGGTAQTVQQNETRMGDGTTQSWTMGYDLASAPTITVDGVAQTVGLKGASGSQFYWAAGDNTITQDSGQTKLTAADTLAVSYIGQYPTVISDANAAQVAYEAALDGTTGIIEEVETDQTITSAEGGLQEASNLLTRYAQQGVQFVFTTLLTAYEPGQMLTVNYAPFGFFNAQMLVEEVLASDQVDNLNIWYTVTAIQGPYDTTYVDFFAAMLGVGSPVANVNVGSNSSLAVLASFTGSTSPSASFTATVCACPICSASTLCNTSTIVC